MRSLHPRLTLWPFLFVLACGESAEIAPSEPAAPAAAPTSIPATPQAPTGTAPVTPSAPSVQGDETACLRAEPCCRAFVEAIGDEAEANRARAACESLTMVEALGDAADDACANAIEGWRAALEARDLDVPTACAASVQ